MRDFEHGPFKLGSLQLPSNFIAAAWVVISTVRPCCRTVGIICPRDSLPIAPALERDLQKTDRRCHKALCEAHMPTSMQHDKQNLPTWLGLRWYGISKLAGAAAALSAHACCT